MRFQAASYPVLMVFQTLSSISGISRRPSSSAMDCPPLPPSGTLKIVFQLELLSARASPQDREPDNLRTFVSSPPLGSPVIIVQVRSHSPDSRSFQFSQSPAKVNGRPVFHGDRERQLRFSRFAPFVKSVCRNQAAAFCESLPERRRFIDGLSSRIDSPISDLRIFDPIWNQSPLQRIERTLLSFSIEANGQDLLTRRNVITDG